MCTYIFWLRAVLCDRFCEKRNRISGTKNMRNFLNRLATGSFQERLCFMELLPTILPHIYFHVDNAEWRKCQSERA